MWQVQSPNINIRQSKNKYNPNAFFFEVKMLQTKPTREKELLNVRIIFLHPFLYNTTWITEIFIVEIIFIELHKHKQKCNTYM